MWERKDESHPAICTRVVVTISYDDMDVQEWDDQHEHTYSNYVRTQDVTFWRPAGGDEW